MAKLRKEKADDSNIRAAKEAINRGVIKIVPIDSIEKWEENPKDPKKHKAAVKRLSAIIKVFGQITPIVVYTKDNKIRKGHTTIDSMRELNYKEVQVKFVEFPNEVVANAYAVADNEAGTWDPMDNDMLGKLMRADKLGDNLTQIKALTGLTEKNIKSYMLSEDLPPELDDVDLQGITPGKSDFVVLQFEDKKQLEKFKNRLGLKVDHQRVIPYDLLIENMKWR